MKQIGNLKLGRLQRGLFAVKSGMKMLPSLIGEGKRPEEIFFALVGKNVDQFIDEVGEFKGSLLKAAQVLSMYGEYYLPPEINNVLKKVQGQNHFLKWESISSHIPKEFHEKLEIEQNPVAAASIGQVHKAKIKATGETIVLKIRYPGVEKAIDVDMALIKGVLSLAKVLPKKMDMSGIYGEIKRVLAHEMDYIQEAKQHAAYSKQIENLPGFYVPKLYPEFCNDRVIASEFIEGTSVTDIETLNLGQEEKDHLGFQFYYLFYHELFKGNILQTDCHGGNYLIRRQSSGELEIVLIDFGACLTYDESTLKRYRNIVGKLYQKNRTEFFKSVREATDGVNATLSVNEDLMWDYCLLASSPMHETDFDWGNTKLPEELYPKALALAKSSSIDRPPHEFIFIDRKVLGLFAILRSMKSRFNVKKIMDEFVGQG